ncbi:MAG: hypothetical protein EOO73_19400 [Myxococcales bacterium]|nr:MAG: hypothetical protein EOO73_19400 [Myxococcales bacterium]
MKDSNLPRVRDEAGEAERREALLREQPLLIGAEWAKVVCGEALQSRGSIDGGWPGTVPEARGRIAHALGQQLSARRWAALTPPELAAAASAAYHHARRAWQVASKQRRPSTATAATEARKPGC